MQMINVVTHNMDLNLKRINSVNIHSTEIVDFCTALCQLENERMILMVVIYTLMDKNIDEIIGFHSKNLATLMRVRNCCEQIWTNYQ